MNIQHSLDQVSAMMRDFAPLLRAYHLSLVETGFTEEQAFVLVKDYQQCLLGGPKNEKR